MALPNTVAAYRYVPGQDADAGAVPSETALINAAIACSVQPDSSTTEVINKRVRQTTRYRVYFTSNFSLKPKDLLVWVDPVGATHNLFVTGQLDRAGRSTVWGVWADEVN